MRRYVFRDYFNEPSELLLIVDCKNHMEADKVFEWKHGSEKLIEEYVSMHVIEIPEKEKLT